MLKKTMLLAMAVGALVAFAAPAAMAQTTITNTDGEPATTITAFSSNLRLTTTAGILDCDTVNLTGGVTSGTPATISSIHGTATSDVHPLSTVGECPVRNTEGKIVTGGRVTAITGHASLEGGTALVSLDFTYDITVSPGVFLTGCTFEVNNAEVPYTTTGVITFTQTPMGGGGGDPAPCADVSFLDGELQLDGTVDD
jgi:hypothetical protein